MPASEAPRAPGAVTVPAGATRDDLVAQWRGARTDNEKAQAAARIAAFDAQATRAETASEPAPGNVPENDVSGAQDVPAYDWASDLDQATHLPAAVRMALRRRYPRAEAVLPKAAAALRDLAAKFGGKAIVAPLKGVARAGAKLATDYALPNGRYDIDQLKDLVRGTIAVANPHTDAPAIKADLEARYGQPIKWDGANSLDPDQPPPLPNGYRGINSVWRIDGEPVEIQINLPEMLAAKKKAHTYYAQYSELKRKIGNREPTNDEKAELTRLNKAQRAIYQPAWEAAMRRLNSSGEMKSASSSKNIPGRMDPSDQDRATWSDKNANRPSGSTPNTVSGGNESNLGSNSGRTGIGHTSTPIVPETGTASAIPENGDFVPFGPESDTLGVPRSQMPQIKRKDRAAFLQYLDDHGIGHKDESVPASELKPTQAEYSPAAVQRFAASDLNGTRRVLVSSDGYVLDGHHQAIANREAGTDVPITRIDAPIRDLLKAADEFPDVQHSPGADGTHAVKGPPTSEVAVGDIDLNEIPQFKEGADEKGVVEPLGGTFDRRGVAPIQLWQTLDGKLHMVSGRHRLDLAKRSGETTIPAQVYREADGYTKDQMAGLDAELNIRDGQGKVADYVQYLQAPEFDGPQGRQEADARGILARSTGRRAYTIAHAGTDELIAAHRAGQLSDEAAVQIAQAAPNNEALQNLGMKLVGEGKPIGVAANAMQAARAVMGPHAEQMGLFAFDDSAIHALMDMSRVATAKQREIREQLAAVKGAAKRPEKARALGVDVKDPDALNAKIADLKAEADAWAHWATDPELSNQVRREAGLPEAKPPPDEGEPPAADDRSGTLFSRAQSTQANYDKRIDELFDGAPAKDDGVRVLDEGDVLTITGYGKMPVVLAEKHAVADGQFNHGLTRAQWKQVPEWLDNPAAVFERTSDGHLTIIAPDKIDGHGVVIGLEPEALRGRSQAPNHLLLTVYPKDRGILRLASQVETGHVKPLYIDTRKGPSFYKDTGLQYPGSAVELRAFNHSLKTGRDLVKYRTAHGGAHHSRVLTSGDLFGAPTNRERTAALERERDALRNGKTGGREDTGDGGLFDGQRPEQVDLTDVEANDSNRPERSTGNAQQSANGIPDDAPATPTEASRKLVARLNNWRKAFGERGRFDATEIPRDVLPDAMGRALDAIEHITGIRVHVIRNLTPDVERFNGVSFRGRNVFVDARTAHPITTVALHEFTHTLRAAHPDLYAKLENEVRRQGRLPDYQAKLAHAAGAEGASAHQALEELTADAVGDALSDPAFLGRLAERNPSAFRRLAQRLHTYLSGLVGHMRGLGSNPYLTDVTAFRDQLAEVMDELAHRRPNAIVGPEKINGHAVIMGLDPNVSSGRGKPERSLLLTAYEKDNGTIPTRKRMERGELKPLYVDQRKGPSFYADAGVQFPERGTELRAFNHSLKTGRDLVKYRASHDGAKFSRDLLGDDDSPRARVAQEAAKIHLNAMGELAARGYGADPIGWTGDLDSYLGWRQSTQTVLAGLVDRMDAQKRAQTKLTQTTGQEIEDYMNAYRLESLMGSRAGDRLDQFQAGWVKPIQEGAEEGALHRGIAQVSARTNAVRGCPHAGGFRYQAVAVRRRWYSSP